MSFKINGEVNKEQYYNYNIVYYKPVIVETTSRKKLPFSVFGYDLEFTTKSYSVKMSPLTSNKDIIINTNLAEDVLNRKCNIYQGQFYLKGH